jgi:hypothetical protein
MGWLTLFSRTAADAAPDVDAVTRIRRAQKDGGRGVVVETSASPARPEPPIPEEIKRHQVSLILRYVLIARAR